MILVGNTNAQLCENFAFFSDDAVVPDISTTDGVTSSSEVKTLEYQTCVICMEDLPGNELRQHNACDCVICTPCLDRTIEHHQTTDTTLPKDHIKCPGCRQEAEPSTEFVTLDQIGEKCFHENQLKENSFRAQGLMSYLNLALAIQSY